MKAVRLSISGHVQGVGFRMWTRRNARRIGVFGWVMNERDGTVSAHAEGDDALVEEFVTSCHRGPPGSSVDRVLVRDVPAEDFTAFNKR